jgi:hypothetical protein
MWNYNTKMELYPFSVHVVTFNFITNFMHLFIKNYHHFQTPHGKIHHTHRRTGKPYTPTDIRFKVHILIFHKL